MTAAYDIARNRVREFDLAIEHHQEAMDCLDCDDRLFVGIEAFRWLERIKVRIVREFTTSAQVANKHEDLAALYALWLKPSQRAIAWADSHLENNYEVQNYPEFLKCVGRARAFLANIEQDMQDEVELSPTNAAELRKILQA